MTVQSQQTVLDPICGMRLVSDQTLATFIYIGQQYSFCSQECCDTFRRAPEYYVALLAHDERGHCGFDSPTKKQQVLSL